LHGGTAVVVDVLRATTAMVQALASGCTAIVPCLEVDEARRAAAAFPAGTVILGGERQGVPIPGFDFGNSPGFCTPEVCSGKALVMTTTNGTRGILSCLDAERVLIASFQNALATCAALAEERRPLHIVCSGTDGNVSLEDTLLAGTLIHHLAVMRGVKLAGRWERIADHVECNDSALLALGVAWPVEERTSSGSVLQILSAGRGGHRVRELGYAPDIEHAAGVDRLDVVAELAREPLRIVRVS
jgi:2-phosphosulfolactate phosphatase